ncbi:glycoside hydrolase family 27 protein [Paenibacillus frigoriresistens]|uniref:glycoside hydrolase family 27 protein n=1 Tax=Paenibacillus alginolyticus TaxID=59839 RepID=UPI0015665AC5|nr:glycoside hydrolase family 27 protein [Paenibacillus frigoriresistens]NRF92000.1 glycoside hydrolase family 27 protein [Paenibacillus frigoriresistens]
MTQKLALTPPMGWNSWDCYGASVTEEEVRANAAYMAEHLKPFGWEYVVVDIQWYEPRANSSKYRPFVPLEMDDYARLIPAVNRFPSSKDGQGFKPLGDYIHSLGLKFGIHIMRGIPRQAVHAGSKILGTDATARDIAHTNSICPWNTDMYGVNAAKEGAQAYYQSLFQLYAQWGVDFVKVDDVAASRLYHFHADEIGLIREAINQCGRDIVLSLSPGPAPTEQTEFLKEHANMWRMTDDYWDQWELLHAMFERCEKWYSHVEPSHWPDCDMLPLGHIEIRSVDGGGADRWTRFTPDEQTMMTLWCIFRSPLMFGGELRDNDDWTLSLLTNPEVLRVLHHSHSCKPHLRERDRIIWTAEDEEIGKYVALFNTGEQTGMVEIVLSDLGISHACQVRDLWRREDICDINHSVLLENR